MVEQGATGDFYGTRAFTTFAVPTGTPQDIVERLSATFMQAGSDARVKQVLANFLLSQPTDLRPRNVFSAMTARSCGHPARAWRQAVGMMAIG